MKKSIKLFNRIFFTSTFIIFFLFTGAQSIFASDTPSNPSLYHISQLHNGTFNEVYTSEFPIKFSTKNFNFNNLSNSLTLNINESGDLPYAGIDAITLNACGTNIDASSAFYTDTNKSVLEDILKLDLNVVISHNKTIQTTWNLPQGCSSAVLSINANEYGVASPFRFPTSGTAQYVMGSNMGSLVMDGKLDETDGTTPLYSPYWIPSSGHPEGNVYLYAKDDARFLYFAGDIAIDNTDDVGSDWISVTIDGKKFKVTDSDNTYGTCSFGLTSKVSYKHATCELKIPKNEISNSSTTVSFVLGYYGTSSEPFALSVNSIKTGGDNRIAIKYNDEVTGQKSDYSNLKIAGNSRNILTYSGNGTDTIVLTFDGAPAGTDTTGTIDINNVDSGGTATTTSVNNGKILLATQFNYPIANMSQTGDFFYLNDGTNAEIYDYIGPGGDVTIPSAAGGYPVTSIAGNVFDNKLLTSVTIPASVSNLGFYSFADNPMLKVAYFLGNAPSDDLATFNGADSLFKVVYLDGATGFTDLFDETYSTEVNPFTYTTSGSTAKITGYTGNGGDVVIPDHLFGLTVTSIDDYAFDYKSLTSVIIPDSVTSIGESAFSNNNIVSVNIPNNVLTIGDSAFNNNDNLLNVTIGSGLSSIGDKVFSDNKSLALFTVNPNNNNFSDIDGVLFNKNGTNLVAYPEAKSASYVVPNSVTTIGDNAFLDNQSLTNFIIPNSVLNIGVDAFSYDTKLESVTIGRGLANLSLPAFAGNESLTQITVDPNNNNFSDIDGVLFNKDKTTLILYPMSKNGSNYTVPDSVINISDFAFSGNAIVNQIILSNNTTDIGQSAFNGCTSLNYIYLPDSLVSIGDTVAMNTALTDLTIPENVTNIGYGAFSYNSNLAATYFLGNSPNFAVGRGADIFNHDSPSFTIYHKTGATGFGNEWNVYTTMVVSTLFSLTTSPATLITSNSATLNGEITSLVGSSPTIRGFQYGKTNNYGITLQESGTFTAEPYHLDASNLTCGTLYHYRSFAMNKEERGYGDDQIFTTSTCVASNQVVPDDSGDVTVGNDTPEVLITNVTQPVTITVNSGTTNATVNVSSFITGGSGILPQISINSDKADIVIPASTTITSTDTSWAGIIAAPKVTTITLPETSGQTKTLSTAIEVGFSGTKLSFNKAVRILLPNQSGKRAGYTRDGGITLVEITNMCSTDNGDALGVDQDCKIDVGTDLVIWTRHFTTFFAYTQTTNSSNITTDSTTSGGSSAAYMAQYRANQIALAINSTPTITSCLNGELFSSVTGIRCPIIHKNIARNLKLKSTGDDVKLLQIFLNTHGFIVVKFGPGSLNKETNYFGAGTKAAVVKYQKANKLTADGIVGPKMRKVMGQ